jgi:glycosyltransferase involved in cell wall biosynthesis
MTADAVGGVWPYALELARGLNQHGIEVGLATLGPAPSADQRAAIRQLDGVTLWEGLYRLEWMNDPWSDLQRAGDWLLELESFFQPQLIHLNGYSHAALRWRAPVVVVAHSCVFSWWNAVWGTPPPAEWNRYRGAVTRGLRSAGVVIAPSRAMLDALRVHYGDLPAARVIPNSRALLRPENAATREEIILTVGRIWDAAKNIVALDRVAPDLPWPVYAAGAQTSPDGMGTPPGNLRCLGSLSPDELAGWMRRSAIYALPARYEPFGLSILEAAIAGCALVLGEIPSLRENWEGAALFVPPGDDREIKRALAELIAEPSRREQLGSAARQRSRRFDTGTMTREYLEAYSALLLRHSRSPQPSEVVTCAS